MSAVHLLIVDHESRFSSTTRNEMEAEGIVTTTAVDVEDALQILEQMPVDVVILDIKMGDRDGIAVLQQIKRRYPMVEVILTAGQASVDSAVKGLKMGAFDYILRPCDVPLIAQKVREACVKKHTAEDQLRRDRIDRIIRHPMAVFDKWHKD